jgi:hypothetical protein
MIEELNIKLTTASTSAEDIVKYIAKQGYYWDGCSLHSEHTANTLVMALELREVLYIFPKRMQCYHRDPLYHDNSHTVLFTGEIA